MFDSEPFISIEASWGLLTVMHCCQLYTNFGTPTCPSYLLIKSYQDGRWAGGDAEEDTTVAVTTGTRIMAATGARGETPVEAGVGAGAATGNGVGAMSEGVHTGRTGTGIMARAGGGGQSSGGHNPYNQRPSHYDRY
ncbi:hypothetical protein UPYG_G00089110 [Umbra pygmaea]|uniref:Uncharacterized protein n=1 Tax=Umbra pygmaea TaxID=75934 RepID=A0ABD0XZS2_UMBPY